MCGIFGFYLNRGLDERDIELGHTFTKKLSHRGPDNLGTWYKKSEGIFLGHTRLSIIDLSKESNQPFHQNNQHLIFNGEIYNFQELRSHLISKGDEFHTHGDTEVLSHFLRRYGVSKLDDIDGMFAFANYMDRRLTLATDIFGEKPLYWSKQKDGFYFSSEPAPLVEMLKLVITTDESFHQEFNTLGYLSSSKTMFEGLYKCEPASLFIIDNPTDIKKSIYWKRPEIHIGRGKVLPLNEAELDDIANLILDSLSKRIYSDVDMGLFLSSGIDSSLIACMLKKDLKRDVLGLTVSFDKNQIHNESIRAKAIAEYLNMEHLIVDSQDPSQSYGIDDLKNLYGEPNDNITVFSVRQMSRIAKKYFTVALSGTGGDELFLGYGKHQFIYQNEKLLNSFLFNSLLDIFNRLGFSKIKKLKTAIFLSKFRGPDLVLALKNNPYFLDPDIKDHFAKAEDIFHANHSSLLLNYMEFDLGTNMPFSIIPSIERGSMKEALEVRTPFLNKNLLELVSSYDCRRFLLGGQKVVLRKILSRYLPQALIDKEKKGFVFPINQFLENNQELIKASTDKDNNIDYIYKNTMVDPLWSKLLLRKILNSSYE